MILYILVLDPWPMEVVPYFPNTVYFMSRWGCLAYVRKNWEPLVSGPLLAMDTTPRTLCCRGDKDTHQYNIHVTWSNACISTSWLASVKSMFKHTHSRDILTFKCSLNSSSNFRPQILVPPFPVPTGHQWGHVKRRPIQEMYVNHWVSEQAAELRSLLPMGSPVCTMKPLMLRWKMQPS